MYEGVLDEKVVIVKCAQIHSKEIKFLKKLIHTPGTVTYINHFYDHSKTFIIFQLIPDTIDLFKYISNQSNLSESIANYLFRQLFNIILWCQQKHILHGNITDENILINPYTLNITLINFSSAQKWIVDQLYSNYSGNIVSCPPEFIMHNHYTADSITVWTLGFLLFKMFFGTIPFNTIYDIVHSQHVTCIYGISKPGIHLLNQCLNKNPGKRIKLHHINFHDWLQPFLILPFSRRKKNE